MVVKRVAVSEGDLLVEYSAVIEDEIPILPALRCYKLGEEVFESDAEDWIYNRLHPRVKFNFMKSPAQVQFDKEFPLFSEFRKLLNQLFIKVDCTELDPTYKARQWVENLNHFRLDCFFNNKDVSDYAKKEVYRYITEHQTYYENLAKQFKIFE